MKKSLIALAALATVGAAQAQSSVTVYGVFDAGYNALKFDNVGGTTTADKQIKASGLAGSGPLSSQRLGFRGTEDLGGGLKANFNLEYGFASNQNGDAVTTTEPASTPTITASSTGGSSGGTGGALTTRTSRVGLESNKLGRLDIGYGLTGLFATVTGHSPLPGNNFIGDVAYTNNSSSSADSRILLNAVRATGAQYTSPSLNGVQAVVDLGAGAVKRDGLDAGADSRVANTGLTLRYNAGALALAATTHTLKYDYSATAADINSTDYQAFSARYAVNSQLALNALYAKNKSKGNSGAQVSKNDVTQVVVSYTMGKNQLVAQYGEGEGQGATASADQRDRKGYQLGAIHNLSKRTNVYAIYGYQDMTYVTAVSGGAAAGAKEKVSGYAVGLRHSF